MNQMRRRWSIAAISLVGATVAVAIAWIQYQVPQKPPNVIFIVLDTVRSDRLSLCGHDQPTTPNLQQLRDEKGWRTTCGAKTAGTWTLPSHASFFSGVSPVEHRAHAMVSGIKDLNSVKARTRKLYPSKGRPSLAERFLERGYTTVAVSGNPVVNAKLGLLDGFEIQKISKKWADTFDEKLIAALESGLDEASDDKPLFLFLNIADAHAPWTSVPKKVNWLPQTRRHRYKKLDKESFWQRFIENRIDDNEAEPWLDRIHNLYMWGIRRADTNVARALEVIEQRGLCQDDCRIVLTSDHGEMTGEHRVLDHGHYVWEEMVSVPLMTYGIDQDLPAIMSATDAFDLLLDGHIQQPREVTSMGWPHIRRCAHTARKGYCDQSLALWIGQKKYTWINGEMQMVDLEVDPLELQPTPILDPAIRARLEDLSTDMTADASDIEDDAEVIEVLRSLGYVD
jgi:arylsulfatase A-like enzyme